MAVLHIRYDGENIDVELDNLDVGDLSTDTEIKNAAAGYLDIPENKVINMYVDRNPDTGDITMRPPAVFG